MKHPMSIPPSDYHSLLKLDRSNIFDADSYLSKSAIWEFFKGSPYKWQYHPRQFKPTEAMRWGSLVDCLTTAPEDFDTQFLVRPATYYHGDGEDAVEKKWNGNANFCRSFAKSAVDRGLYVITKETLEAAQLAAHNLTETHEESARIFAASDKQIVLISSFAGVNFKGLVDLAPRGERYLADLKTTSKFSHDGFEKQVADLGYHVQAGLYLALWNACFPDDQRDRFRFIWQESSPPYEVAVTELSSLDIADGQDMAMHICNKIISHAKSGKWPMKFEQCVMQSRAIYAAMSDEQEIEGYIAAP